jgi:hypothetical protein
VAGRDCRAVAVSYDTWKTTEPSHWWDAEDENGSALLTQEPSHNEANKEYMPNINEAFPSAYLKASDLQNRTVLVTIERVEFEPVGPEKKMKPILYFVGKEKGLVLNKTNANKIMQLTSSPVTEEWHGFQVAIYPTETSYQGDTVECIRVKPAPVRPVRTVAVAPPPLVEDDFSDIADDDSTPF